MGWIAPVAAAAHQRNEEAEMVKKLKNLDPEGRFEYKIVRGGLNDFHNQEYLQQVLDAERQGSWEFVEKIDNARIILRRSKHSQLQDNYLDPDYIPYRTSYGTGSANVVGILVGLLILVGLMFLFGYQVLSPDTGKASPSNSVILISVILFLLIIAVIVKIKRK
jgi:hypothetical protein